MRRRVFAVLAAACVVALLGTGVATAHPLGNFSVNHLTTVSVSSDRIDVRYVLDQAEIPTFQERDTPQAEVLAAKRAEVERSLALRVDGKAVPLKVDKQAIAYPAGQGGLHTTRVELSLSTDVSDPARVDVDDETFPGRVGWKDVIVAPGDGTRVRSDVPSTDPTDGLHTYPKSLLTSPADQRTASLSVESGGGSIVAPSREGAGTVTTRDRGAGGFSKLFDDAAAGNGVLILLLLAAFGWGALHALSPGHGKAMVAAYLVGSRGTASQALLLGATVTVTHTIGVFALGFVTLGLSAYILPEDLYPWLNLVAGLMVVVVGASVLRARLRDRGEPGRHDDEEHTHDHSHGHGHAEEHGHVHALVGAHHGHEHGHEDDHSHHHEHSHDHSPDHSHDHRHADGHMHSHGGGKAHSHDIPEKLTPRGLIALGASAGLIPCPSALVVLLGAVAQHEIALGLLLIVVFSLGLAATLSVLGLMVVWSSGLAKRLPGSGRFSGVARVLPALSSVLIVAVGLVLTAQALPQLL